MVEAAEVAAVVEEEDLEGRSSFQRNLFLGILMGIQTTEIILLLATEVAVAVVEEEVGVDLEGEVGVVEAAEGE